MFEELNLQDEYLIPTSHAKIRSYVGNHIKDLKQIKTVLLRLQKISEEQDIAGLVLLLKELIPDYNPGAELLKAALSTKTDHAARDLAPVLSVQSETPKGPKLTTAAMLN